MFMSLLFLDKLATAGGIFSLSGSYTSTATALPSEPFCMTKPAAA